jgi:hypothetical protein
MPSNPAQIGNHKQLHTLLLGADARVQQFPEYTGSDQILSVNTARCFQSRGELEAAVQWWQVAIHAHEVYRQTEDQAQADALVPLSAQRILNLAKQQVTAGAYPAGPTSQVDPTPLGAARCSALKARVTFTDQTATQRVVELDIGGGSTLSFAGSHVGVDVLYPEPAIVIAPNANRDQLEALQGSLPPGIVLDSWIQASAAPAPCAPIGRRAARYTLTRNVQDGVPFVFELPAGAVEVQIYATGDQAANRWRFLQGPLPAAAVPVATIPAGVLTSGDPALVIPGTSRWLEILPSGAQTATVVFTLEY